MAAAPSALRLHHPAPWFEPGLFGVKDGPMRVMTWNVQGRVGDWEARHGALRSWIEQTGPDVLTLQESWVEPDGTTQAARLGEELDRGPWSGVNRCAR